MNLLLKKLFILSLILTMNSCSIYYDKFYTNPETYYYKTVNNIPYDALIIPGFPHFKDSMSVVVKTRVYWAKFLYDKGYVKNIIFSGSAVYTPFYESIVMAKYAEQIGIPKEHIFIETQAEHSIENLYYSLEIANKNNFKKVALATEVTQSSFIRSLNNHRYKLKTDYIPIIYDSIINIKKENIKFNQDSLFVKNFNSLVNREGTIKRLYGTRGKKVKQLIKAKKKAASSQKQP